jgi:hypothetical protein
MNPPNIKIYIIISGILIVLFLIVSFVPFGRKNGNQQGSENFPTPTLFEGSQLPTITEPSSIEAVDFTGAAEEEIPPDIANSATERQNLMNQTPFDTGLFQVDFDYNEDKFIITLAEPKQENRQQFDQWLKDSYPNLNTNQFNFR